MRNNRLFSNCFIAALLNISIIAGTCCNVFAAGSDISSADEQSIEETVSVISPEEYDILTLSSAEEAVEQVFSGKNEESAELILMSGTAPEDSYGANDVFFYEPGEYYILSYDSASDADQAESLLESDGYEDNEVFPNEDLELSGDDGELSPASAESFDGISAMGLDKLSSRAEEWDGSVSVAVIDCGIDSDHSWFSGRIDTENSINISKDAVSEAGYDHDFEDSTNGHGTHVAGIIAKATPSTVQMMIIKIFWLNEAGNYTSNVLHLSLGIDYAGEKNADVINTSLVSTKSISEGSMNLLNDSMSRAIENGTVICTATGNNGRQFSENFPAPACSSLPISVGSVQLNSDGSYTRSSFSNYGDELDFSAPGSNILSAELNNSTGIRSGTSMAVAHISAAAAMIRLKHPEYSRSDIYQVLLDNSEDLGSEGFDMYYGNGFVNLAEYEAEEAHEHSWDDGQITKASTAQSPGVMTYTCTVCGETRTETIPAKTAYVYDGIDYSPVFDPDYYWDNNSMLQSVYRKGDTPALLYHFVAWGMDAGLQASPEYNVFTYMNRYPYLRSVYADTLKGYYLHYIWWGMDAGLKGDGTEKTHIWDKGKVTERPTSASTGIRTYTCTDCGASYTETIPATADCIYDGIDYSPVFDPGYYWNNNKLLQTVYRRGDTPALLYHFYAWGMNAGLQASEDFNVYHYMNNYPWLKDVYGSILKGYYLHYIWWGMDAGLSGSEITG